MIVLVLGGVRSGKSSVAERVAAAAGAPVTYVATARPAADDADLEARIAEHRRRRPPTWTTRESGADLAAAVAQVAPADTVLVDSLGTWLAGLEGGEPDTAGLVAVLEARPGLSVLVGEEVGLGVHPPTAVGRRFADALGTLNRRVGERADHVLLVAAGRATVLEPGDDVLGRLGLSGSAGAAGGG